MPALFTVLWIVLLTMLGGCATGRYSTPLPEEKVEIRADQASVVFLRPSILGSAISSSVFELTEDDQRMIGIPGPEEKIVEYLSPGRHRFMVVAESADFIEADLLPGRAYYVVITPRFGVWKSRFSMHPIKQQPTEPEFSLSADNIRKWNDGCKLVQSSAAANAWAQANSQSIRAMRAEYWPKWLEKPAAEQRVFTLEREDGLPTPL